MKTLHSLVAGLSSATLIVERRIAFPMLYLSAGLVLVLPCAAAPFEFEDTGSLNTERHTDTATLLPNGKVLVAGGISNAMFHVQSDTPNAFLLAPPVRKQSLVTALLLYCSTNRTHSN